MAQASVTLITRAEVTSIADATTGRKALVLDETTIELGDTGPRDLSGIFIAGKVASGRLLVQRDGSVVTWSLASFNLASPVGSVHDLVQSATLVGFMPSSGTGAKAHSWVAPFYNQESKATSTFRGMIADAMGLSLPSRAALSVKVDGGAARTITVAAGNGFKAVAPTVAGDSAHTHQIDSTTGFHLTVFQPSYSGPKLKVTRLGRGGSAAVDWAPGMKADGTGLWDTLLLSNADAVVVGLGTNGTQRTPRTRTQ